MKTKILSIFMALAFAVGLTGCDDDWNHDITKTGTVSLSSMGVEVSNVEQVMTRAGVDVSSFLVKIYNAQGSLVEQWVYSEMPEVFTLPVGENYVVRVESHAVAKAEWEHPYFKGEKTFSITDNKITEIGVVTCKFASLKVSIRYTDSLRAKMGDDVKVTVVANDEGRLEYNATEARAGFFDVIEGSTTLVATFTGTVGGYPEELRKVYTDVAPGQHRIITFDLKTGDPTKPDQTGTINPGGFGVDVSVEDEFLGGNANVGDEDEINSGNQRPGGDDGGEGGGGEDPNPPTPPADSQIDITSATLNLEGVNNVADVTGDAIVKIVSKKGIAHFEVSIKTNNSDFESAVSDLMPLNFDLAYPGNDADNFASIGFPVGDQVIGATDLTFDITQFVPLLSAFPGEHTFTLTVTDENDFKESKSLIFKAQ